MISIGISKVSPVGKKSRLGISVRTTARCQGKSPAQDVDEAEAQTTVVEHIGQARSAQVDVHQERALSGTAQVAARFSAVVLLPSPGLALVTRIVVRAREAPRCPAGWRGDCGRRRPPANRVRPESKDGRLGARLMSAESEE